MNIEQLRLKRIRGGIPGSVVCAKVGRSRSWLSTVERGYKPITDQDAAMLDSTLDSLIRAREEADALARTLGWPGPRLSASVAQPV